MKKVSVIVPVYNSSQYINQCIDSLLNQTLKEIEFIFIDDGSSDNSLDIIKSYAEKDERIIILTQEHKKQGAARNLGVTVAQGEYIGFVDSDDWVEPEMFEKLYAKIKETDSDITMCATKVFNEQEQNFLDFDQYSSLNIFKKEYFQSAFTPKDTYSFFFDINVYPWNKIYRTSFLRNNNIKFPEQIYFEDEAFFYLTWLKASKISLIETELYNYRKFANNSTCFGNDIKKLDLIYRMDYLKQILKDNNVYNQFKEDFYHSHCCILLYYYEIMTDARIKLLYILLILFKFPLYYFITITFKPYEEKISEYKLLFKLKFLKKKTVFWGASIFLENILKKYNINSSKIIGIVDKNKGGKGLKFGEYEIITPEQLQSLKANEVIMTIVHKKQLRFAEIKKFLNENDIRVKLSKI